MSIYRKPTANEILLQILNRQHLSSVKHELARTTKDTELQALLIHDFLTYYNKKGKRDQHMLRMLISNPNLSTTMFQKIFDSIDPDYYDGLASHFLRLTTHYNELRSIDSEKLDVLIALQQARRTKFSEYFLHELIFHPSISSAQLATIFRTRGIDEDAVIASGVLRQPQFKLESHLGLIDWTNVHHLTGVAARPDLSAELAKRVIVETDRLQLPAFHNPHPLSQMVYRVSQNAYNEETKSRNEHIVDLLLQTPYVRSYELWRFIDNEFILSESVATRFYESLALEDKLLLIARCGHPTIWKLLEEDASVKVQQKLAEKTQRVHAGGKKVAAFLVSENPIGQGFDTLA